MQGDEGSRLCLRGPQGYVEGPRLALQNTCESYNEGLGPGIERPSQPRINRQGGWDGAFLQRSAGGRQHSERCSKSTGLQETQIHPQPSGRSQTPGARHWTGHLRGVSRTGRSMQMDRWSWAGLAGAPAFFGGLEKVLKLDHADAPSLGKGAETTELYSELVVSGPARFISIESSLSSSHQSLGPKASPSFASGPLLSPRPGSANLTSLKMPPLPPTVKPGFSRGRVLSTVGDNEQVFKTALPHGKN